MGEDSDVPNEGGLRLDVVEALRALDIPNLRWPGGCFADTYHWRDGVGPREDRPTMVNSHWGDVVEDNSFGTHEFMALCELLGADPYVSANVGSGTVREAAEWIEYLTRADDSPMARLRRQNGRDEPWTVPFWGLGNEPWGCGGGMGSGAYAELARQFGTYSLDHGDNHLYRIAAGAADADYRWTEVLLQNLGRHLGVGEVTGHGTNTYQAVSFHHYTIVGETWDAKGSATRFDTDEYYRTMVKAAEIERILAGHAAVMDAYDPEKRVGLVLDEWGTWFDVEPGTNPGFLFQQNTLRDALVASVHFDAFHRHADRLVMANIAQTVNVLQAMLLTDGDALVLTPSYHVFAMNKGTTTRPRCRWPSAGPPRRAPWGTPPSRRSPPRPAPRTAGSSSRSPTSTPTNPSWSSSTSEAPGSGPSRATCSRPRDRRPQHRHGHPVVVGDLQDVSVDGGLLRVTLPAHSFATVGFAAGA